jgi:diguanylate cyclase (GGDEF)-like protein
MAIRDPLTGLYNRRYFNDKLDEEISRSRRTKMPVSLIYMDIDHFKKYNDQNGHPMGDQLLKMFATILAKTSRKNDIVARIGGEEFVMILPHTDARGAAIKAEKLRRTIESTKFPFAEKQPLGCVSSSIGVSEYPSIAGDAEALVKAADDALYQIKSTTRNRVGLAAPAPGFKPDFEPIPVVPAAPRTAGS